MIVITYLSSRIGLIVPSAIDPNSSKVRSNCITSEFLEEFLLYVNLIIEEILVIGYLPEDQHNWQIHQDSQQLQAC